MIKFSTSFFFFGGLASLFFSKPSSTAAALFFADDFAADAADECLTVETVQDFDLQTYISKPWYVQQQAENTYTSRDFDRCVTAQYVDKGYKTFWGYDIGVYNVAFSSSDNNDNDNDNASRGGDLCAFAMDESGGQLKVAPCFLPKWTAGPYWVVAYDEQEGYALISGGPPKYVDNNTDPICGEDGNLPCCKTGNGINNSGLWIFTRERNPSNGLVDKVQQIALAKGYSTRVLFNVDQSSCDGIVPDVVNGGNLRRRMALP